MAHRAHLFALLMTLSLLFADIVHGKTLRWAAQGDVLTIDPHAQIVTPNINFLAQVYDALVGRDRKMKIVPGLAVSWKQLSPTLWRFELRPHVRFHDGSPFTADDVVFSLERANQPPSNFRSYAGVAAKVTRIDDLTVDIETTGPNPVLVEYLFQLAIMNKVWCVKHNVEKAQDYAHKEETYAARNANGTGPYMLKSREPDVKTVLVENPHYWGRREGNITEAVYLPIKADATRVSALLSGEVDFILDPPVQDVPRLKQSPSIKVVEGTELRIIYLGMDQSREELLYSDVKGKNPFKDVRVRTALYQSIDIEAIKSRVMRGQAQPAGAMTTIAPATLGLPPELDERLPLDRARAKKPLAEAGYPDGFEVTLDCPNNRYINDEAICTSLAAMFAQIGVRAKLNVAPFSIFFPRVQKHDTSLFLLGWGPASADPIFTLRPILHSKQADGAGDTNYGRFGDVKLDTWIDHAYAEMDQAKRKTAIIEALTLAKSAVFCLPLHRQGIPWAMRGNVNVVHLPNNRLQLSWTELK